jgi:hypothetical protein
MRFLSRYGRFGVQIRPVIQEAYATGMARVLQEPVYAMFRPEGMLAHERELALNHWSYNGLYQLDDEVSIMPPDYRIGVFDSVLEQQTSGWSDELREEVENELIRLGEIYDTVMMVPATSVPPPWPRYDDYRSGIPALVRKLVDEGHDLEQVLEYERANKNRPELCAQLEALIASPDRQLEEIVG